MNDQINAIFEFGMAFAISLSVLQTSNENNYILNTMTIPKNRSPTHPSILIQDTINELGMTQLKLAKYLNIPIQQLKRDITPDTALRLSKVFRTTPEYWLNLQMTFDLYKAKKKNKLNEVKSIPLNKRKLSTRAINTLLIVLRYDDRNLSQKYYDQIIEKLLSMPKEQLKEQLEENINMKQREKLKVALIRTVKHCGKTTANEIMRYLET